MFWGDGYGFKIYNKVMLWSVDLDKKGLIWKYVESKPKNKRKKKNVKKNSKLY